MFLGSWKQNRIQRNINIDSYQAHTTNVAYSYRWRPTGQSEPLYWWLIYLFRYFWCII